MPRAPQPRQGVSMRTSLAVVLAAGEGTRMRSRVPKVLHSIGRLPLIGHVLASLRAAEVGRIAVVVGPGHHAVSEAVETLAPGATLHLQMERRGTAHAVLAARSAIEHGVDDVLVIYGDTPFLSAATVSRMLAPLAEGAAVVVGGATFADPTGYGRLLRKGDRLLAIREEKDASADERAIRLGNAGFMALAGAHALPILDAIGDANAQ